MTGSPPQLSPEHYDLARIIDALRTRLGDCEAHVAELDAKLLTEQQRYDGLQTRVTALEAKRSRSR
jgi:hypothetical protein